MKKETQIILAVGAVAVAAYFVNQIAKGANQAEANIGTGIGNGVENFGTLAGVGVLGYFAFLLL